MVSELRGVLLDVDGTLVLSNDAHAQAWVEAFAEHGYAVAFERIRPLMGMGGDMLMATVTPELNDEEGVGKRIAERRKAIFLERYAPTLRVAPGARGLVERLRAEGLRLVVASSAKRDELQTLLQAAQVADLLEHEPQTSSDEAEQSKPAPDVVEVALGKLGLRAEETLLVGDTPYDIRSGGAVGVAVVAVRCGGFSDAELLGALAIYDHPADLVAHFETSPLVRGRAG